MVVAAIREDAFLPNFLCGQCHVPSTTVLFGMGGISDGIDKVLQSVCFELSVSPNASVFHTRCPVLGVSSVRGGPVHPPRRVKYHTSSEISYRGIG